MGTKYRKSPLAGSCWSAGQRASEFVGLDSSYSGDNHGERKDVTARSRIIGFGIHMVPVGATAKGIDQTP